jgi:hypothetical protein
MVCLRPRTLVARSKATEIRDRDYFLWDEDLPGFGLRVFPSGRKRYVVHTAQAAARGGSISD